MVRQKQLQQRKRENMETITNPVQNATRRGRNRSVKYIWQNPNVDIQVSGDSKLWGEQIELEFSHNASRKRYEATMRRVLWQPSENFTVTMFTMFDRENYPSICFHSEAVARYGDKSFARFEADTLFLLERGLSTDTTVERLLNIAIATPPSA